MEEESWRRNRGGLIRYLKTSQDILKHPKLLRPPTTFLRDTACTLEDRQGQFCLTSFAVWNDFRPAKTILVALYLRRYIRTYIHTHTHTYVHRYESMYTHIRTYIHTSYKYRTNYLTQSKHISRDTLRRLGHYRTS